jgi:rhodanese-related sulfurtransferase
MLARAVRQAAFLLCLALFPALVSGAIQLRWHHEEPLAPGEVLPATAEKWGAEALFVDARSQKRFDAGHIQGAVLLNDEEWETLLPKFLDAWDPDKKTVVYCDGGGCDAAQSVAERMRRELQLQNVYVLKGGWPAWQNR